MSATETNNNKPLVVGMSRAGEELDCGDDELYRLIKAGELELYLEGNRRKIVFASIERHIAKRLAAAGDEFQRGRYPRRPKKGSAQHRHSPNSVATNSKSIT